MKLSEAIRKGAALRPQARHGFFKKMGKDRVLCSCALAAAYEAATGTTAYLEPDPVRIGLKTHFPQIANTVKEGEAEWVLGQLITVKNDFRNETREQIAEWAEAQGY